MLLRTIIKISYINVNKDWIMKNFKEHPITSIFGILFTLVGMVLWILRLFIETKTGITWWEIVGSICLGLLLTISEDSAKSVIITILTLGINKLVGKKEG